MKILQLYKMFNFLVIYILEAKASYVFFFFFFLTRYLVTEMEEISVNFITILLLFLNII